MAHRLSAPMFRSAVQGMACTGLISMRISALKDCWLASSRQKVLPRSSDGCSGIKQDNPKKPPNIGLVRHEVVCVAVMTVQTGHNLVFCHQYPPSTCVTGHGGV